MSPFDSRFTGRLTDANVDSRPCLRYDNIVGCQRRRPVLHLGASVFDRLYSCSIGIPRFTAITVCQTFFTHTREHTTVDSASANANIVVMEHGSWTVKYQGDAT